MFNLTFTTPITFLISLAALAGVTLHDTKLDKLATSFVGVPAMTANTEGSHKGVDNTLHTHVERMSFKDVKTAQPRIAPRNEQKKYFLQKNMPKGAHAYDGYRLPLA
jgi:hypothetical protein